MFHETYSEYTDCFNCYKVAERKNIYKELRIIIYFMTCPKKTHKNKNNNKKDEKKKNQLVNKREMKFNTIYKVKSSGTSALQSKLWPDCFRNKQNEICENQGSCFPTQLKRSIKMLFKVLIHDKKIRNRHQSTNQYTVCIVLYRCCCCYHYYYYDYMQKEKNSTEPYSNIQKTLSWNTVWLMKLLIYILKHAPYLTVDL